MMSALIENMLYQRIGMDIKSVGQQIFQRVLQQQLHKYQCDLAHYSQMLQHSEEIWTSLVEAIVIPETWFFRYPESFSLFEELVHEQFRANPARPALKILCLPCSTGEEAYSIAISLLRNGYSAQQFCVDAIDINTQALQQAQSGIFRQYSFRTTNLPFIHQFFEVTESGSLVNQNVRDCVKFSYGNLFEPATLPAKQYDFVFCRNLLIYFDQNKQQQAIQQLRKLLSSEGYLLSGPAEAGAFVRAGMTALPRRDCFAFSQAEQVKPKKITRQLIVPATFKEKSKKAGQALPVPALKPSSRINSSAPVLSAPAKKAERKQDLLQRIEQLSNAGQLSAALELCQTALSEVGPSAQLFYIWGLLFDSMGHNGNAEIYYRKVLYLEPLHAAALRQLAALLHSQGQTAAAALIEQRMKLERKF